MQVFSPQIVGGALPISSTKKAHKGKEKMTEVEIHQQQENLYETKKDFDFVSLGENDDSESTSIVIK